LGEAPRPELREHGRISGACFDAALGVISGLKVIALPILTVTMHVKQRKNKLSLLLHVTLSCLFWRSTLLWKYSARWN
jgi:hypothetical protein